MTAYQVFAFCEGMWASPKWWMSVDLSPRMGRITIPKEAWKAKEVA